MNRPTPNTKTAPSGGRTAPFEAGALGQGGALAAALRGADLEEAAESLAQALEGVGRLGMDVEEIVARFHGTITLIGLREHRGTVTVGPGCRVRLTGDLDRQGRWVQCPIGEGGAHTVHSSWHRFFAFLRRACMAFAPPVRRAVRRPIPPPGRASPGLRPGPRGRASLAVPGSPCRREAGRCPGWRSGRE